MKNYSLLILLVSGLFSDVTLAVGNPLVIIANASVTINHLSIDEIKDIYLLQNRQWSDSLPIVVVNRPSNSEIRSRFEQDVLGIATKKYALHLQKMHYQGMTLPVIQESTQAVIAFVQNVPGAIAYIEGLPNNRQIKVLMELK
ncbi:MAG: substrate-binding domain-containing protein [Methylococcales bacterium]